MAKRSWLRQAVQYYRDADALCEIATGKHLRQVGSRLIDAFGKDIGKKIEEALDASKEELPADNPYSVLHCRPSDKDLVIRGRYRLLVKEFHPDGNNPDVKEFQRVVEAFNAIKLQRENPDR